MSRATLILDADTSAISRAFASIPGMVRNVEQAMTGEAVKGATQRKRVISDEQRARTSAEREAAREKRAAERAATQEANRASRERIATGNNETKERIAKAAQESRERIAITIATVNASTRAEAGQTAAHEREEKRRTDATRREEAARARAVSQGRRQQQSRAAGFVRAAGATLIRGGMQEHDAIQDARRTRATSNATVAGAVGLAGGNVAEVRARQHAINTFAAAHGFDASEIAEAARAGQAEFNVLGDRHQTREQRDASFQQFLGNYRAGADTFADPAQHVRLAGMLQQRGITGGAQTQALSVIGAATQAGAIEEGSLTREGMAPLLARMTNARARTGETAQAAQVRALTEAVTEMEVARQAGPSARNSGNVLRNLDQNLRGGVAQDKLLNNIAHAQYTGGITAAQQTRLRETLYEADPTRRGHMRLRAQYQNGVGLAEGFQAAGINGQQLANITGGGGRGNAQGLRINERNLLSTLMNGGGIQAIREMQQGGGITEDDRSRMQAIRESEDATRMQADSETLLNERTTGLASEVSNTVGDFQRLHPAAAGLAEDFTRLGTSVGGWMGMRAMLGYSATTAAPAAEAAAPTALRTAANILPKLGLLGGGIIGASLLAGNALHTDSAYDEHLSVGQRAGRSLRNSLAASLSPIEMMREIARGAEVGIRAGLAAANITATVTPHDAAHANSAAPPTR